MLILQEIEIIATSQHENIVAFVGAYLHNQNVWVSISFWFDFVLLTIWKVVMEYMSIGSLFQIVEQYSKGLRTPENILAFIVEQITCAVVYLHNRKRIHRDIKGLRH